MVNLINSCLFSLLADIFMNAIVFGGKYLSVRCNSIWPTTSILLRQGRIIVQKLHWKIAEDYFFPFPKWLSKFTWYFWGTWIGFEIFLSDPASNVYINEEGGSHKYMLHSQFKVAFFLLSAGREMCNYYS